MLFKALVGRTMAGVSSVASRVRRGVSPAVVAGAVVIGAATAPAVAGPPVLGPIPEVIEWTSIGTEIGTAAAGVLGIAFLYFVGIRIVKKLVRMVTGTV